MKKAEHRFHRDKKRQIDSLSRETQPMFWSNSNPIFIPKRKKKK